MPIWDLDNLTAIWVENGQHPLTDLLLNDILIIDTAKPCTGWLLRSKSAPRRPYETCGGRMPNEDTVDTAQPCQWR